MRSWPWVVAFGLTSLACEQRSTAPSSASKEKTPVEFPEASPPATPTLTDAPAADARTAPQPGRFAYEGTIAGKPVVLRLRCDATCAGYYFYVGIGEAITLEPTGVNWFNETVGVAKRNTGSLAFETPPGQGRWEGTWRPPTTGVATQPIALSAISRGGPPRWFKRKLAERDTECEVSVSSFEVLGLADEEMEERVNAAFAPSTQRQAYVRRCLYFHDEVHPTLYVATSTTTPAVSTRRTALRGSRSACVPGACS